MTIVFQQSQIDKNKQQKKSVSDCNLYINFSNSVVPEKLTGLVGTGTGAVTPFLANHIPSSITNHARPYKTGYVIMLEQRLLRLKSVI